MALNEQQIAVAADAYLARLSADEAMRTELVASRGSAAVAQHISYATGLTVGEEDLEPLAAFLHQNRAAQCEGIASQSPALAMIFDGQL